MTPNSQPSATTAFRRNELHPKIYQPRIQDSCAQTSKTNVWDMHEAECPNENQPIVGWGEIKIRFIHLNVRSV